MAEHKILLLNHSWLAPELKALGQEVVSVGLENPGCDLNLSHAETPFPEILANLPVGFIPDRIVYYDDSGIPWIPGLEDSRIPKIFYSVDTFHHEQWHRHFAQMFDAVLIAQRDYRGSFQDAGLQTYWFPLWATRTLEPQPAKSIVAAFVGTLDAGLNAPRVKFFL